MMLKAAGAFVAVLFIAVAIVAVGMWRGFIPIPGPLLALLAGAKVPEYSARYYPADTLVYAWATLTPDGGQFEDMREVWERFNDYPAFADLVDQLKRELADDTGIDFDTEIVPWIGPEIAAAVIGIDGVGGNGIAFDDGLEAWDNISAAVTIGVRDNDAAADFLVKWRKYMTEESDADFVAGSHRGFDTWVDEDAHQSYALTDDWLVYATDEKTLKATLNRIDGDDTGSLADDANFVAARAALPERRSSSFYLNYRQGLELFDELMGGEFGAAMPNMVGSAVFAKQAPDWVAGSAGWVERGATMEVVSPTVSTFGLETVELQDPANLLPVDTLGFVAGAFDPDVDHWRAALRERDLAGLVPYPGLIDEINGGVEELASSDAPELSADATLADALDLGFWLVEDLTGIDLEADFFAHLSGQAILSVRDFEFSAVADDPASNAIDAVAMLSYREGGKDGLADTMDEVADLLQNHIGLAASAIDVGADDDATVFDVGLLGMMVGGPIGYSPGYVLHDQYLTIGTTEDALATIVEVQNGDGNSLSSDAEYRRAVVNLATGGHFLGYVDLRRIVGQLEADNLDLERDEYRVLREGLGVVAFSSVVGEDYSRGVAVLTLFPK